MTPGVDPEMDEAEQQRLLDVMAHVLVMGRGAYDRPEEWVLGMLTRFAHEGFHISREAA